MRDFHMYHNSHDRFFRSPFGAVSSNTAVTLRLKVRTAGCPDAVWVRLWHDEGREERVPMFLWREEHGARFYQGEVKAPPVPGLVWYYFIVNYRGREFYYGNNNAGLGGAGQEYVFDPKSYQITVFAPEAATPNWFKEAIIYQIFVDRFHNGYEDGRIINPPRGSLIHPYWEDTPFYVRDMRSGRIFAYDFFGGNLLGIIKKLPYLKTLGVSVIYLNPVFESPSNHKYDTGDYKKIDPMFGDNELFRQLCASAAELGIYIVLDGVFSHTGSDSRYFNREGRYPELGAYQSPESPYFSWYRFIEYPQKYESWWGIDTLPNVNEMDPSYINYMIEGKDSVVKHWLKAGIKGWRLDVADELPDAFIERLRKAMKEQDPDTVLIGEVWEDASRKVSYGSTRKYLLGAELDSVTNYPFRDILIGFMLGTKDGSATQHALTSLYENYPREHFYAAMNLLGTHDVPRILTLMGEAPPQESMTIIEQATYRLPDCQKKLALARMKLLALWQMTFPGTPCIYYGDEAGVEGYTDPFNRGTFPWGRENEELVTWYQRITGLRQRYPVLRTGEWIPLPVSGDIYGYIRLIRYGRDAVGQPRPNNIAVMLLNRNKNASIEAAFDIGEYWQEYLYDAIGEKEVPLKDGKLVLQLGPLEGRLLIGRQEEEPVFPRTSGVLLHPTSLPSPYGIGDMGPGAYRFVDWLAESGQTLWQILPLNPPGFGESPYQSVSAFAGNWWLISPDMLLAEGLITNNDIGSIPVFSIDRVDFGIVKPYKEKIFRKAFHRFSAREKEREYYSFLDSNSLWLENYALFMALKSRFGEVSWNEWETQAAERDEKALARYRALLADEIDYHRFLQFMFYKQWHKLKAYANARDIKIIGDLPIFVSYDSADVWANRHLFQLSEEGAPTVVAGVPPDYFSATGQLWGNPHYDWTVMAEDGYLWWRKRFEQIFRLTDVVRIDHFRGFEACWQVPATETTAENGTWVKGPGADFFKVIGKAMGKLSIIAEDLGIITPSVECLRDRFNFPGMKILHFMFEGGMINRKILEELDENTVIYTGTHDNDTTCGWYQYCLEKQEDVAARVQSVLGLHGETGEELCWRMLELAFGSRARMAIVPLQDIFCLGAEARMNLPGTVGGNWDWRFEEERLSSELAAKLKALTVKADRQHSFSAF